MRNPLQMLLSQLAQGNRNVFPQVCARIGNRVIFVPADRVENCSDQRRVKVSLFRVARGTKNFVPVFTSESLYDAWVPYRCKDRKQLSLFGADLCLSLDVHSFLLIDPDTDHEVLLSPEDVDEIGALPFEELEGAGAVSYPWSEQAGNGINQLGGTVENDVEPGPVFARFSAKGGVAMKEEEREQAPESAVSSAPGANEESRDQHLRKRVRNEDESEKVPARVRKATVVFNRAQLMDQVAAEEERSRATRRSGQR